MQLSVRGFHYWSDQRGGTARFKILGVGEMEVNNVRISDELAKKLEAEIIEQFTSTQAASVFGKALSVFEKKRI